MARRAVLFLIALVLALVGTGAVLAYVNQVDERAVADRQPVVVLIAKGTIPAGMTAQQATEKGLLESKKLPGNAVPADSLDSVTAIREQVAVADIYKGEVLLRPKFTAQQVTGALTIPTGKMAVSVELGDPQRVGGFVLPGAEVAIFNTFDVEKAPDTNNKPGELKVTVDATTRLLLPRIPVIAVGPSTLRAASAKSKDGKDEIPITILTVAVTQSEGEKLVHAAQTGELYFALLNGQSKTGPSDGVNNFTLFGRE
jgi:pilus assembly protein CpaB